MKKEKSDIILKTWFCWLLSWFVKLSHSDYFYRVWVFCSGNKCFACKYFFDCTFRLKLSLDTLFHLSLLFYLLLQFHVSLMKYFESLNILWKRSSLIHYFFQLFILFFYQFHSFILLRDHVLNLKWNFLTKSLNLRVFNS